MEYKKPSYSSYIIVSEVTQHLVLRLSNRRKVSEQVDKIHERVMTLVYEYISSQEFADFIKSIETEIPEESRNVSLKMYGLEILEQAIQKLREQMIKDGEITPQAILEWEKIKTEESKVDESTGILGFSFFKKK